MTDGNTGPLLRSPPFPNVAPDIAAVSVAAAEGTTPVDDPAAVFEAIRLARVGGTFWAAPPPAASIVIRARHDGDVATARLDALYLLPATRWGRQTARRLGRQRLDARVGDVDPWPLLDRKVPVEAHGGDEWAALARIAGAPLRLLSQGQADPSDILASARYRDPFGGGATTIVETIEQLRLWRCQIDDNRAIAVAAGIAWWKRDEIERFLWAPRSERLAFLRGDARAVDAAAKIGGALAIWPSRVSRTLLAAAGRQGVPVVRIEDGFLRSVGLGANLHPPQSITLDRRGIHYDPARPSDLEHLLETVEIPRALLDRAEALRRFVVTRGISKYGHAGDVDPLVRPAGRRLVLVTGQVEDDLSVRHGGGAVAGNLDLLRRARAHDPDAVIWFRPHPDVDAGHRRGAVRDEDALRHADRVVRGGSIARLLETVDAVHVLTSLTGFEALMRGRPVVTHGTPFYAGWGLTIDLGTVPSRRTRRRSLLELVATVLILYPRYLDPVTGLPCPVEVLADRMAQGRARTTTWLIRLRIAQGRVVRRLKRT